MVYLIELADVNMADQDNLPLEQEAPKTNKKQPISQSFSSCYTVSTVTLSETRPDLHLNVFPIWLLTVLPRSDPSGILRIPPSRLSRSIVGFPLP